MEMIEEAENKPEISHNRIKSEEILENEDRISLLPDCLIVEILSRLPFTKDAIKTGTLSKRWIHIWTSIPNLIFVNNSRPDFYSFIDKTLSQCRHINLNKFSLFTTYEIQFESQVRNWIRYAFNCNVKNLTLRLITTNFVAEFELDHIFLTNSCFSRLSLEGCIFNPTHGAISWKNLTCLSIVSSKLDENMIANILSGCPLLETFALYSCYGYRRIDITSKSVKNFVFSGYSDPEDYLYDHADVIEINAPHILSLTIQCDFFLWKIVLLDVSSLVKAELDYEKLGYYETTHKQAKQEMLKDFILKLRHVKDLKIGSFCFEAFLLLEDAGFIFPSNLKYLSSLEMVDLVV